MGNKRFENIKNGSDSLFIPFLTAGDPAPNVTVELALSLQKKGAAVLELGIPYSDPLADGPVIQRASKRALAQGMSLEKAMDLVSVMRDKGLRIPVVIFTYYNLLLQLGTERFFELAEHNDIDGLLVPDLPFEESEELRQQCELHDVDFISLVAPTTSEKRLEQIVSHARGFLYCVSSLGVTGERQQFHGQIAPFLSKVRALSSVPVAIGFGISNRQQMDAFSEQCDGVIVGSAIIRKIESLQDKLMDKDQRASALQEFEQYIASFTGEEIQTP
jgi:tryptophan synthase alpha chain